MPQSRHDMQKLLGLANYFRKFLMGYAKLVAPLQQLTKKGKTYSWTKECELHSQGSKTLYALLLCWP